MRGLLMVEPLYHQTVAGNKTQTRRDGGLDEVNGREASKTKPAIETDPDEWLIDEVDAGGAIPWVSFNGENTGEPKPIISVMFRKKNTHLNWPPVCKPRYKVGEVLCVVYKFSQPDEIKSDPRFKWGNKMFMPSSHAREFIKITGIKCERLLDISDGDCIAEGVNIPLASGGHALFHHPDKRRVGTPKESFIDMYKYANKVKTVPNLWVWVYSFEYLKNYKA